MELKRKENIKKQKRKLYFSKIHIVVIKMKKIIILRVELLL